MSLAPFTQRSGLSKGWRASQIAQTTSLDNPTSNSPWIRNPSWLPISIPSSSEQKFTALYAVMPESNFLAFSFAGAYTIDWGDGVIENYSSGTTCYHQYSYTNSALDNTNAPVTFQGTADTVTRASHGYQNGYQIYFDTIDTTTGITPGRVYFVVNATTDTFQLSLTSGGSAIDLIGDGTGNILPYKQAVIVVTPQAGQNLTSVNYSTKHNQTGLQAYNRNFLDIAFGSPNLTSITTFNSQLNINWLERLTITNTGTVSALSSLCQNNFGIRRVVVNSNGQPMGLSQAFQTAYSLTELVFNGITTVTNLTYTFNNCTSIEYLPWFDTSTVTGADTTFGNCVSLKVMPNYDFSLVTYLYGCFVNCQSLETFPLLGGLRSVTNATNAFANCYSLKSLPLFDFSSLQYAANLFSGCSALRTVPKFNFSNVLGCQSMFAGCSSLIFVPDFDLSKSTSFGAMFQNCYSLLSAPNLNTSNGTSFGGMFWRCYRLKYVPDYDTSKGTDFGNAFSFCYSLKALPKWDTSNGTNFYEFAWYSYALQYIPATINFSKATNLANSFANCYSLSNIPLISLNTTSTYSAGGLFLGTSISKFPAMNFSKATGSPLTNIGVMTQCDAFGFTNSVAFNNNMLNSSALTTILNNLGTVSGAGQVVTISNNYGAPAPVSLSGTTTAGSTTITMANTTGITAGMQVTGIGTPLTTPIAVTFQDSGDTVTLVAHGLSNDDEVSFAVITSTTGIIINKIYYVVNAAADTFQVSDTLGGAALPLTTDGSGTLRYRAEVVSVVPNTSITISRPATSSGTNTLAFQTLRTGTALLKGWTVSQ